MLRLIEKTRRPAGTGSFTINAPNVASPCTLSSPVVLPGGTAYAAYLFLPKFFPTVFQSSPPKAMLVAWG